MNGREMQELRQKLGLDIVEFGFALGYRGTHNSTSVRIREYERGKKDIPESIARLALMLARYGVPHLWASDQRGEAEAVDLNTVMPPRPFSRTSEAAKD